MDSLPQDVIQPLELLIYVSLVLVSITGIFLIKLLIDTSSLVSSLQNFITVTQAELEPTIKEINGTLTNINQISSRLNDQINNINSGLEKGGRLISDKSLQAFQKLRVVGASLKEGFISIVNVLLK